MAKTGAASIKNTKKSSKEAKDLTFGMKNKNKSKKIQQFESQIQNKNVNQEKLLNQQYEEKRMKKALEEEQKLLSAIHGKVVPKKSEETKICQFFKVGLCNKGKNCKYSHDLAQEAQKEEAKQEAQMSDKIDLFTDQRQILFSINKDNINNWDQKKLEEVIEYNQRDCMQYVTSAKICQHFLQAVENKVYGWMWQCPNGAKCQYKHCLPEGYVFKSQQEETKTVAVTDDSLLIDKIDQQRNCLSTKTTPMTKERFDHWLIERRRKLQEKRESKICEENKLLGYGNIKKLSGRELFA